MSVALAPGTAGIPIEIAGKVRHLNLSRSADGVRWSGTLDGEAIEVDPCLLQPGLLSLIVAGHAFRCVLDEGPIESAIQIAGHRCIFSIEDPGSVTAGRRKTGPAGGQQVIRAPMPGRIVRLLVAPGEPVVAHQAVVVIEAMKMQNEIKAVRAGRVTAIKVEPGATVAAGEVLVTIGE